MEWAYDMGEWKEIECPVSGMENSLSTVESEAIIKANGYSGPVILFGFFEIWEMAMYNTTDRRMKYRHVARIEYGGANGFFVFVPNTPSLIMLAKEISTLWKNSKG